jgi:hypothetical protein
MLTLYLERDTTVSKEILSEVKELAVAHRIVYLDSHDKQQVNRAPMICDDEKEIKGIENIFEYFETLKDYLVEWQKFQSDACYCDASGKVE